jgi:DNA-binding transcriptional LysR family regulator
MIPSSSDIAYFIEAASKLNFSRAAESLGISQPSLSMAIRRVEDGIGRALFIRSKRGVTLTQAGKHLLSQAHNLLDAWQNIRYKAVAAESSMEGRYVIGCHSSVALYSLPSFLPKLLKEHARIQLELVHDLSRRIVEGVVTSRIDLGIVVNPFPHPDLVIIKLAKDEISLWSCIPNQSVDSFKNDGAIICSQDFLQTQYILNKLRKQIKVSPRLIESTSLEVVAELASHGSGAGILPTRVAERTKRKLFRIKNTPYYKDEICVVVRAENRKTFAIRKLIDEIKLGFPDSAS